MNKSKADKLTIKQERAIQLMLEGKSQRAIAEKLDVNPNTISEWKKRTDFQEVLTAERDDLRQIWRAKRNQLLEKNFILLQLALNNVDMDKQNLSVTKLTEAIAKFLDQIRQEFNDLPTQKNEIDMNMEAPLIQIDGELWNAI